jgi:hypothetical protein
VGTLVEKEGINDYRNDWVLSRRGQKRLWHDSAPAVVVDKSIQTIPVASDNLSTFRGGSSSAAPADVSADVWRKHDSAAALAASVECGQWLGASRHCDVSNVQLRWDSVRMTWLQCIGGLFLNLYLLLLLEAINIVRKRLLCLSVPVVC